MIAERDGEGVEAQKCGIERETKMPLRPSSVTVRECDKV